MNLGAGNDFTDWGAYVAWQQATTNAYDNELETLRANALQVVSQSQESVTRFRQLAVFGVIGLLVAPLIVRRARRMRK